MATQGWVADRLFDWVKKNPHKGTKDAKKKLESDYGIKLKYSKAWSGMKVALEQIHSKYEDFFFNCCSTGKHIWRLVSHVASLK